MRRFAFTWLALALVCGNAWPRPVDLSAPSGALGAADAKGYLEIWREIDGVGIQLGNSYLPLRYKFSSDPSVTGGILGSGFYVPMFEARNALIREKTMRLNLPCGKTLYMWRSSLDADRFESVDKEWSGYLTGDDFLIWRDDGWKVAYHKSKLTSITTDDGHVFTWTYTLSGLPEAVSENGKTVISAETNAAGQISAFVFNGNRYEIAYAKRPVTEMLLGQVAIKELDQALSTFKYPDGKSDAFTFVLNPDRIPIITFVDRDQEQRVYSVDPATGYLATEKSDGDTWIYKMGQITQDFGVPPISRSDNHGKTESIAVDTKMGTYTALGVDGTTTITHVFKTPGPLYNKVQKVDEERKIAGKDVITQILRASYDESGRLIRNVDEKGYITSFSYGDDSKLKSKTYGMTPELTATLASKEKELLASIAKAHAGFEKWKLLDSLGTFYIFEKHDPSKALALVPQIDPRSWYIFRVQAIDYDLSLSPAQKIAGYQALLKDYPDRKASLDFLIQARTEEENEQTQ